MVVDVAFFHNPPLPVIERSRHFVAFLRRQPKMIEMQIINNDGPKNSFIKDASEMCLTKFKFFGPWSHHAQLTAALAVEVILAAVLWKNIRVTMNQNKIYPFARLDFQLGLLK